MQLLSLWYPLALVACYTGGWAVAVTLAVLMEFGLIRRRTTPVVRTEARRSGFGMALAVTAVAVAETPAHSWHTIGDVLYTAIVVGIACMFASVALLLVRQLFKAA